ncbi:MAG: tetratricopeptide repeat protein [Planctomycetes bacterium]|nr:tetratricopeptide repeat protein [Planctomycetota bacterium]
MGLFGSLFGKSDAPITDPDRLRDELFAIARAGDERRLERLARTNQATVLEHFRSWQKVPEAVRSDPSAIQGYIHCMVAIAETFAQKLGRPELMAALTGPPQSNPLAKWQDALRQAREHMDALRYSEARALLTDALIDSRGMSGTGVDRYLPITHGHIAECHFHAGAADQAVPHLEQALSLCERSGDAEGVAAYTGSLFEAHRYLGQSERAAGYADRMAARLDTQGAAGDAARWRTRARIVRAGEPLNRVVAVANGTTVEVDEMRPTGDVRVQFVFERNRVTLRPATVHTERGEQLGSAGRHEEALAAFREAATTDQFDPHSRYLEAFTLLHLGRYADAADGYRRVEELAPGWFHCRADLWVAEQLTLGRLDANDFAALSLLEDGPAPPDEKVTLAERLLARRPGSPPAHLHLGKNLARAGRDADARAVLRAGLSASPDPDVRTRLLAELATLTEDTGEREALYREAVALNGNLVAAASAAVALRASEREG